MRWAHRIPTARRRCSYSECSRRAFRGMRLIRCSRLRRQSLEKRDDKKQEQQRVKSGDRERGPDLTRLPPEEWSPWPIFPQPPTIGL